MATLVARHAELRGFLSVLRVGAGYMMAVAALFAPAARAGTTWDGGGINTNFTTAANWNDDSAPTFTGGTSTLTFATAGSTATVDTAANLARITLDRDVAFTIANGSGSLTLQGEDVGGVLTGITASPATAGTTVAYTISESIALGATQAWNVANNGVGGTSLSVSGVISGAGIGLTKIGSGTLTLSGANTFTGVMAISGGAVEVGSWNLSGQNGVWGNRANNTGAPTTSFIQMNGGRINYTGASASGNLRGVNLASGPNTIDVATGATLNFASLNTFQSNGGDLVKEGGGTLQLGSAGVANNIFIGKATINSGTLDWFGGGSMPAPAALVSDFLTINDDATFAMSFTGGSTVNANIGFRLSGNATMLSGGGSHLIAGPITDGGTPGSLQKTGTGTLTLSASNSFTGSTRAVSGTLNLNNASALLASTLDMNAADSGGVTFSGSTTLGGLTGSRDLNLGTRVVSIGNNGQSTFYSGVLSNGSLTKVGSGTLTLSGSNSYSGNTTISAGRLVLGGNGVLGSGSYAGTIANAGELVVGSNAAQILSGVISGTGSVTKSGAGTLTLSAANTYTGSTSITAGVLNYRNVTALGTGTVAFMGNATLQAGVAGTVANAMVISSGNTGTYDTQANNPTLSGIISGAGSLTKIGSGTLALSGANTFSGPLTVAEGVLSINSWNSASTNGPLGNSATNVILGSATSAGTLRYTGGNSNAPTTLRGIELAAGGGVIQMGGTGRDGGYVHLSGTSISGSGPLTINSPGMTRLLIVGSSTFSGPVIVQAGELQGNVVGSGTFTPFGAGTNGLGSAVTVGAGAILTTFSSGLPPTVLLGSLAGSGTVRTESSGITQLRIGGDDTSTTFAGQIQGTFAPVKVGSGTLTLSGSNSYSGSTTISAGRLALASNGVLGSGSYAGTIANAGDLVLGSNAAQILAGVISGSGSVTKAGAGTLTLSAANTFSGPLTVAEGVLSIAAWNNVSTNGPLGNSAANVVLGSATSAGTLRYTGGNVDPPNTPRGIELAAGGGVIELAGAGRDAGRVHISGTSISGSGPLTINSPGMTRFLLTGGSSGFSGPVRVQAGELQANVQFTSGTYTPFGTGSNGLGSAMTIDSGAILNLFGGNNINIALGSLAGSGTVNSESGVYTLRVGGDNTSTTFSGVIRSGFSLTKVGAGALSLTGTSLYSGATTISAGRLVVDGSILASSGVSVASGAELGGSGRVAAITGAGLLAPGNSPGILTAPSASFTGGLDFAFEFTQAGAPTWSSAASSGNDVLRLTDATTPLVGTATSGNVFDIYFAATGETYIGGIFTDRNADFANLLTAATFNYFVRDAGGAISYGGFSYASLAAEDVTRSIVQVASADFAGGTITNGYAMQFVVVPEPGSLALAGLGLAAAAAWFRRRT